ncbi:Ultraviolet-B receptor UVR8 [Durusdinium trenchii]|uniref:Ultraviolet-B receptor UVR8 n=1 Tax=Durusdinium trenchii TaxID=1381693 RepID=A0ABP0QW91_9DINO
MDAAQAEKGLDLDRIAKMKGLDMLSFHSKAGLWAWVDDGPFPLAEDLCTCPDLGWDFPLRDLHNPEIFFAGLLCGLLVGTFLRRAILGEIRGPSGRDRIKQASKIYIVCKDRRGQVFTHPMTSEEFLEGDRSEALDLDEGAERGSEGLPGLSFVYESGHTNYHYEVGRILLADELSFSAIILIAEQEESILCAVPFEVWNRRVSSRLLPSRTLSRPLLCSVEFMDDLDVDYGFKAPGLAAVSLPYAEGLVNLVQEKFEFLTAESGPQGELGDATRDRDLSGRLSKVEAGLGEIREFLMELREKKTRSDKSHTSQDARKSPTPPATPRASALRKNPSRRVSFAGLDPSVVDAALQAGVPEAHLQEMSGLLASRPSKMEDLPRPGTGKPRDPLSDSEDDGDELVPDADAGSTGASSSDTGVARAIVKLTKVCSHLANQKSKKKGDQLEHLLDLGQGSEGSIEGSGLGSSKKAAALRVLKRQLTENPKALFESIESNLHSAFAARPIRPGVPTAGGTVRGWLESRSRVQNYTGHVRWCWQVAGIWDCLIAGEVDQARARWLDLLLHYVRELDSYQEAKRRLGSQGGFPLPLPYPEVLRPQAVGDALERSRKKMMNVVVIALNYTTLGRPRSCPSFLLPGRRLNAVQWGIVRRLEAFLEDWLIAKEVGPESMGRAAPKIESIEEALKFLTVRVQSISCDLKSDYFGARNTPSRSEGLSADVGEVVGKSSSPLFSTFKELDPDRLRFVGTPSFDPVPYLDPAGARIYQYPLQCRVPAAEFTGTVPHVRMHCSFEAKIRLFELLDQCKRLKIVRRDEIEPRFASGMFSVVKSINQDRLILDSRPANALEIPLEGWIKSLGSAEMLTKIYLPPGFILRSSGSDPRDFYHLFLVGEERARRNVLCGGVPPSFLKHLDCFPPELENEPTVFGCLATLAMGDTQAVTLAQTAHLSLALRCGAAHPGNLVCLSCPVPRGPDFVGIVIDDYVSISKVRDVSVKPSHGALLAKKIERRYGEVGLVSHPEKGFEDEEGLAGEGIHKDPENASTFSTAQVDFESTGLNFEPCRGVAFSALTGAYAGISVGSEDGGFIDKVSVATFLFNPIVPHCHYSCGVKVDIATADASNEDENSEHV